MKPAQWIPIAALFCAAMVQPVSADLTVGDPAPEWKAGEWIKGQPVQLEEVKDKQVVVIEFWATWCGPCVASIPHLTELQKEYADKGVTIIGFTDEDPDNGLEKVKKFVADQGEKMAYSVAFEKEATTYDAYMKAAGQNGIPTAFVIDKEGRVAWIGHPMGGLDDVLEDVVAGTYDIRTAARVSPLERLINELMWEGSMEAAEKTADLIIALDADNMGAWVSKLQIAALPSSDEALSAQATPKDNEAAIKLGEEILRRFADKPSAMTAVAWNLTGRGEKSQALALRAAEMAAKAAPDDVDARMTYFQVLADSGKHDEALRWANETVNVFSDNAPALSRVAYTLSQDQHAERCSDLAVRAVELAIKIEPENANHLMTKFDIQAYCKNDVKGAMVTGEYLVEKAADDAGVLNNFAWDLLTNELAANRFNDLALKAAERCHEISGGENWMYLDTLALAKFVTGSKEEAVSLEKKAIELCPNEVAKTDLEKALARFEGKTDESM